MTYGPGRRPGVPVLRNEWREPLRAHRDPMADGPGRTRSNRDERPQWRKQSRLGRFIATYGWRAYALPVLGMLTVVVIFQTITGTSGPQALPEGPAQGRATIDAASTDVIGAPPKGLSAFDANLPTGILPDGGVYTEAGAGTWHVVAGTEAQVGTGTLRVFSYTVEVEDGIDTTPYGGDAGFAQMVSQTLANPKSWTHNPEFAFRRIDGVSGGEPDFRVSLTSPLTIREGCGYQIQLEASCYNPSYGPDAEARVFINEARWVRGAVPFQGDVGSYRQYVVNHEVGHAIGYHRHEGCEKDGGLAPVMMQQTFSTEDDVLARFDPDTVAADGKVCRFNPWPYPIA